MWVKEPIQKTRLVECFGNDGARVILEHFEELDQTFGSTGGKIIMRIMQGEYHRQKEL